MDNYERLTEGMPARLPADRGRRASAGAIRDAVAGLPLANPPQAAHEVEQILDAMLATAWAGGERIAALEHLRVPVASLCAGIERELAAEPHPLSAAGAERALTAQRLQERLAHGYALGLSEVCAPDGRLPMLKAKLVAMALVRALGHADRVLGWAYRRYQSPPTGTWRRVHALHAFASELALVDRPVGDPLDGGAAVTARGLYVRLLLLALCNPYRFSAREVQDARAVIRCVADLCALSRAGGAGIGVDVDSDAGPGNLPEERAAATAGMLALDTLAAERVFDERIAWLPEGTDAIDLPQPGGRALTTSVRFLRRLRVGWSAATRGHARLAASHVLDVVVGMHALHFVLAGELDFANFVRQVHGDAITVGAHDIASTWVATADAVRPPRFRAEILDQSEGGYRMRLHGADGLRVRIGEVVGLAPAGDEGERDWMVGVIRWLRQADDAELLGIELLQRVARAAGVRPLTGAGEALAPLRAVALADGVDAGQLRLLLTHPLSASVAAAEVALPALVSDWRSSASVATWQVGGTEALGPACFRVTLGRDEPAPVV